MIKARRRIPKLRYVILTALVGWALFHYWFVQRPELAALAAKQADLKTGVSQLEKKHQQLTEQTQLLQDPNYVARYAAKWGYTQKGQVPFEIGGH